MLRYYDGTPGSGKSFHMAKDIRRDLRLGRSVIATFKIDTLLVYLKKKSAKQYILDSGVISLIQDSCIRSFLDGKFTFELVKGGRIKRKVGSDVKRAYKRALKDKQFIDDVLNKRITENTTIFQYKQIKVKKKGKFMQINWQDLKVDYLWNYAKKHHLYGVEHQTCIYIDEGGQMFNPREWNNKDRVKWCEFMNLHRHSGFDICLTSQQERQIDRQIRGCFEYVFVHRKVNNAGFGGLLVSLTGRTVFAVVQVWYVTKIRTGGEFVMYDKIIANLYDSYQLFHEQTQEIMTR